MSNAANASKFARSAARILRQIETYATTGGDCLEASRTEIKLAAARDRLEDMLRPLELDTDAASLELMGRVKQACRDCRDRASAVRRAANDTEIARIDAEIAAKRADDERRCPGINTHRAELRAGRR